MIFIIIGWVRVVWIARVKKIIALRKIRMRNMHLKRRDVSEKMFISSEYKLNKKHALEAEGCFGEDVHEI